MALAPDDPRHGTLNGYNNLGCRCRPCQLANNAYQVDYMRRHPEQRERQSLRERRRRDPDGSKAARLDAEWRERQAKRNLEQMRREERAEARELVLRLHAEGWSYQKILDELKRLGHRHFTNVGSISRLVRGYP